MMVLAITSATVSTNTRALLSALQTDWDGWNTCIRTTRKWLHVSGTGVWNAVRITKQSIGYVPARASTAGSAREQSRFALTMERSFAGTAPAPTFTTVS